ncbi:MAG: hypothetical protein V3V00_09415 [Saprospiraceae bacterium]
MKKKFAFFLLALFIGLISCSDADNPEIVNPEGTFIFGSYNGFCQGNCTHLFKYEEGEVFRDEMDKFEINKLMFSETSEAELTTVAQRIFEALPSVLTTSTQETYGCPGCADQSTLFVQMGLAEGTKTWYLDSFEQEDWPQELKDYVKLLVKELDTIIVF